MSLDVWPFGVAHHMGLLPLVWLSLLRWKGRDLGLAWWLLGTAFAVSWLADTAAHWINPWLTSPVYLVSQAWIVGTVFVSRRESLILLMVLVLTAVSTLIWRGIGGPDVLLHTVAWLSVVGILWQLKQLGRLRTSLLVYFGVGWFCWLMYCLSPGWSSWSIYQATRLLGILLFCRAAISPLPNLKLTRA